MLLKNSTTNFFCKKMIIFFLKQTGFKYDHENYFVCLYTIVLFAGLEKWSNHALVIILFLKP